MFRLRVMGDVVLQRDDLPVSLNQAQLRMISAMVALGGPISGDRLAEEVGFTSTPKSWIGQQRTKLGADLLPPGSKSSPGYRLGLGVDEVDAWWLTSLAPGDVDQVDDERLVAVLQPGDPYRNVSTGGRVSELLERSVNQLKAAQRVLALEVVARDRRSVMARIVGLFDELIAHHPFDETVVEADARLRAAVMGTRFGAEALNEAQVHLFRLRGEFSPRLSEVAEELARVGAEGGVAGYLPRAITAAPPPGLPQSLAACRIVPYTGGPVPSLSQMLGFISAAGHLRWCYATGPAGLGKTMYVSELAARAVSDGAAVVHLAPSDHGPDQGFDVFARVVPSVRHALEDLERRYVGLDALHHGVTLALRAQLESWAESGPLVVVVTQAHRLDSPAVGVLRYLMRSALPENILFVLAGNTDPAGPSVDGAWTGDAVSAGWRLLAEELEVEGATALSVPPLDLDGVDVLVRAGNRRLSRNQAIQLSRAVLEASGGLPGAVLPILASLDDDLAAGVPVGTSAEHLGRAQLQAVVDSLDHETRLVGAAAALLGAGFNDEEVVGLLDLSKPNVNLALTRLAQRRIVVAEEGSDRFRFATHQLQQSLLGVVPQTQRAMWHTMAADMLVDDPLRRARHVAAQAEGAEVVGALVAAAEANLTLGHFHEATLLYRQAVTRRAGPLPPSRAVGYVSSLERIGHHDEAEKARSTAYDEAMLAEDHPTALAVLLAGWPETEAFSDFEELLARLEAIDPELLSADERIAHACQLSRHLALAGRAEEAHALVESVIGANDPPSGSVTNLPSGSVTDAQRLDLVLARRYVSSTMQPPELCRQILVDGGVASAQEWALDPSQLAELAIFEAVDAYEAADRARLDAARARLADVADGARPIRQWHARLLEGVYAADADDAEAAVEHREAAFQHAVGHGIRHAVSVRLAARFAEELLAGRPLTAAEDLNPERYPGLDSNPPMLEAGVALMLEYHGEANRALAAAEGVAELSLARVNRRSAPCLTLVAPILARSKRDRLVMKASELLLARGDVMVLAGMFVAGLGPSPLAAAHLARRPSDRKQLLQRAGRVAEQAGSARWHRHLLSL